MIIIFPYNKIILHCKLRLTNIDKHPKSMLAFLHISIKEYQASHTPEALTLRVSGIIDPPFLLWVALLVAASLNSTRDLNWGIFLISSGVDEILILKIKKYPR